MKVLYVHGYNSNANSTTSKLIRELSDFEVHTITYNPEHPIEAIKDIRNYCKKYKIDLIIGSSLGGFLTMNCFGYKRIVINPCFKPSIELPKIGYKGSISEYEELENELIDNVDQDDWDSCYGFFAKNDELLGLKYKNEFDKILKHSNFIPGGHRETKEALMQIIEDIPEFLKYINETLSKMN